MLKNYLKIAVRNMLKHKGFSFINMTGLAVGIACCILIFLWIQHELSYDRFNEKGADLYRLIIDTPTGTETSMPYALVPLLKRTYPEIARATRFRTVNYAVKYGDRIFYEGGGLVDVDFFEMFTFPFVKGNSREVFPDKNSVVISEKCARKYFGNDEPIGKILTMDNRLNLAVTGVIKNVPANSHLQFDFLAPIQLLDERLLKSWDWESFGYLLFQPNVSIDEVRKKIADTILKYDKMTKVKTVLGLQPLNRIHLYPLKGTAPITYIYIFSAIALIVLLIACINFINLSTARTSSRAKEVGMRKVFGAQRIDIIKQFIGESVLMTFFALIAAIVLVLLILPSFNTLAAKQLSFDPFGNPWILLVLILITLVTGVLASSYTALFISSFKPIRVLRSLYIPGSGNYNLRRILVVVQFTLAVILIISTIVVYNQINYIRDTDLGFDKDNILTVFMNPQIKKNYNAIKNEMLQNPDIVNVASATNLPLNINNFNDVYWEGRSPEQSVQFRWVCLSHGYFELFNMKMAQGTPFSEEFSPDNIKYIINETALKYMEMKEPIGKRFTVYTFKGEISGVAKDFHSTSLHNEIPKVVFALTPPQFHYYLFIKMRPGHIAGTVNYIKETLMRLAPGFPLDYYFLDEAFDNQYKSEQQTGTIFKYFTLLAIFISCLGLYGLVSYTAEQKTKEIGIRKVFGATVQNIINMISKEFVKLVILSSVIALPIAYYVTNRWLQDYAYHTHLNIWIFFISTALAIIITILTVWHQAFKAARANALDSIKYE